MLKGLKSLFFEEVEEDKAKAKPVEPAVQQQNTVQESTEAAEGQISQKFVDILFKVLRQNDAEGFDYLEFRKSLRSLKQMQEMDETTRFKSAYAMAQAMGGTKDRLKSSAEEYLRILKTEEQKFQQALESQKGKQILSKEQEIATIKQQVAARMQKMEALQKEIEQLKNKAGGIQQEIKASTGKIAQTRNDFVASYNSLVNQIRQDIANIDRIID